MAWIAFDREPQELNVEVSGDGERWSFSRHLVEALLEEVAGELVGVRVHFGEDSMEGCMALEPVPPEEGRFKQAFKSVRGPFARRKSAALQRVVTLGASKKENVSVRLRAERKPEGGGNWFVSDRIEGLVVSWDLIKKPDAAVPEPRNQEGDR